jgi:hypothetical protein
MSKWGELEVHVVSWLCVGAVGASCGGRSTEVSERNGAAGHHVQGNAMGASRGDGTLGTGGSRRSDVTGGTSSTNGATIGGATARGGGGGLGNVAARGGSGASASARPPETGGVDASAGRANGITTSGASAGGNAGFGGGGAGGPRGGGPSYGGMGGLETKGGTGDELGNAGYDPFAPGGSAGGPEGRPAAAVSLSLVEPDADVGGNLSCIAGPVGGFTYAIGDPERGRTEGNGTNGLLVVCTIADSDADGFDLEGTVTGTDENGYHPFSFSISSIVSPTQSSSAVVTFSSGYTGPLARLDDAPECALGPPSFLRSGEILTDIDCPLLTSPDGTTNGCRLHGTIAFEYCETTP